MRGNATTSIRSGAPDNGIDPHMKFDEASTQDLKRLLELFPITSLRQAWAELKGVKDEVCFAVAEQKDVDRIGSFVLGHFSCCKQHVYVFPRAAGTVIPDVLLGEPPTLVDSDRALFIMRVTYEVVLRDPLEETSIDFLLPIMLELSPDAPYALVRFVVLEKSVPQYFDRPCYVPRRSIEEKTVLSALSAWGKARVDLHKGIKQLWSDGFMDSSYAKLKKALSMASETMDEERGIREHNPELYDQIDQNTLLSALFTIADENCGTTVLSAQPTDGYLAFPRYSEIGGTDRVVAKVLRANQ